MSLAKINIKFFADIAQFSTATQNANRKITKLGKNFTKAGKNLSIGLTAPIVALGAASVIAWDKQEKAIAQVEAGLKSTGNAVGYTSEQLQKMATELQNNSLFGDEEILQGATAQLLTFTNIAGEQFKRTQLAALDLSAKLGTDLKSSSIQLGKALNDPVANLSALSRSGIQFSKEQKQVINSLVATNKLADAQTIILDELANQYGGAAEAAAKAGLGPFKQMSNIIGDLSEDFGAIIGEALLPFIEKIKGLALSFKGLSEGTKKTIVIVAALAATLGPLLVTLGFMMTTVIPGLTTAFAGLSAVIAANPIGALVTLVGLAAGAYFAFSGSVEDAASKQETLNKITETAAKSIAKEKAVLAELLSVAQNEKLSKEERLKAIKEINKLSPEYLGNLTLETINTNDAKKAIDKYNTSLLETAKIKAAQKILQDNQAKQIAAEIEHGKIQKQLALEYAQQWKDKQEGVVRLGNVEEEVIKTSLANSKAVLDSLKLEEQQILDIITATKQKKKVISQPNATNQKRKKLSVLKPLAIGQIVPIEGLKSQETQLDNIYNGVVDKTINFSDQMSGLITGAAASFAVGMGEVIGGLMSGTATMGDVAGLLLGTIGDLATQLGEAAIAIGITMLSIKAAFSNPFTAIAAGIALVAVGAVISNIASQFSGGSESYAGAFANGGVVGGNSFSGDKLFARVNSGEMILNKQQQNNLNNLIGPGNAIAQTVKIELAGMFKMAGRDMQMVLDKNSAKVVRTS